MEKFKSAAILLSRQNLRPSLADEWLRQLKNAVEFVKSRNFILLSSVGTPNWEIITACAVLQKTKLAIYIPEMRYNDERLLQLKEEFDLPSDTQIFKVKSVAVKKPTETEFKKRDQEIIAAADIVIPIAIRPSGNMSQMLDSIKDCGREIIEKFLIKYEPKRKSLAYEIKFGQITDKIKNFSSDYVIHWTRATNGPWPHQKKIDYYKNLLTSVAYPYTALAALKNIAAAKRIYCSSKNMPGKIGTVSFSELKPVDTIKLMKWRARYKQMSFEPYGIGIEKQTALNLNVNPVHYYEPAQKRPPDSIPNWLTQSKGKITDWRHEKEFRHPGDFDLTMAPADKIVAITHRKSEAQELEQEFGVRTFWFCE